MRGDYLAIVTLGFGEIARILLNSEWLAPIFGGAQGITNIPDLQIGPLTFSTPQDYFYPVFLFVRARRIRDVRRAEITLGASLDGDA